MLTLKQRLALAWRIVFSKNSNLQAHASRELLAARQSNRRPGVVEEPDALQDMADTAVLEMVACFSTQGHSGTSAPYVAARLDRLLRYQPLIPLTGHADEWTEVSEGLWQNKRCSSVFKDNERAWDIDATVFRRPDGVTYTSGASRAYVQFPYVPKPKYISVAS